MKVTKAREDLTVLVESFVRVISKRVRLKSTAVTQLCPHSLHCHQALEHGAGALRHDADAHGDAGADAEESAGETTWSDFSKGNLPFRASPGIIHSRHNALIINFNDASPGHRR